MFSYKSVSRKSNSGVQAKPDATRLDDFHRLLHLIHLCFLPFQINFLVLIPFYTSVRFMQINILPFKKESDQVLICSAERI